jgi:D-glycero-alpha-D-manno-heptose 1-phosphate guanylyltransferase
MSVSLADIPVLILVGGKGTRLMSLVSDVPKPMAPIDGKPFLSFILAYLKKFGFRKIIFLTGYKADVIQEYFGNGEKQGLEIRYSHENSPLGTGGAIRQALEQAPGQGSEDRYLILNGDTFYNIDYRDFVLRSDAPVNIALHHVNSAGRYGAVLVDGDQRITAFTEKSPLVQQGHINAGIYLVKRDLASKIPEGFVSLESDVFPALVQKRVVKGISMRGDFIDIGVPEDYLRAKVDVPRWIQS